MYMCKYVTPKDLEDMYMISDGKVLTGLLFENSKDYVRHKASYEEKELPIFKKTAKWLDIYFSGKEPDFVPEYAILNSTKFFNDVCSIMLDIPYGKTTSYNDIAKKIASKYNIPKMSAQAVGGAVGRNPICIIIPCHRVVGANGNLTGYGGGIQKKIKLSEAENIDMSKFTMPKNKEKTV